MTQALGNAGQHNLKFCHVMIQNGADNGCSLQEIMETEESNSVIAPLLDTIPFVHCSLLITLE